MAAPSADPSPETSSPQTPTVYLLDAASGLEARLLGRWVARFGEEGSEQIQIASSHRRGRDGEIEALSDRLARNDDPFLVPLRVVWMAPERAGRRSVGWSDILKPGDPRDPKGLRAQWIRLARPGRVRVTAGEGARSSELSSAHDASDEVDGLAAFVTRRAWRALDKAERSLRGNRYKIPRFVPEAILSRGSFIRSVDLFAAETGTDPVVARRRAERYLREIAATHSPYVIDLIANVIHALYRQGYGRIRYRQEQVTHLAEIGQASPMVFLPSHRSNLDRLSLQFLLWENDLPPNHTAGGINLNFFPIGPLLRRTGVFFIRRSFKDNQLYKIVLRSYIDFLVEKRFPLEWYMEGGRSRSGKLLPPKFGLLQYVVDSLRRGRAEDVILVPVSIAYDQIQDVPDYTREAQGRSKEKESISWLVRAVRSLRRRYGDIHVRFGEAVSVASVLRDIPEGEEPSIGLQKLAFEVMHRIAQATPATQISLVAIALLAARGEARTAQELAADCAHIVQFLTDRGVEITEDSDITDPSVATYVLDWLGEHGAASSHEAIGRKVYWLDESQMIQVSYYRNVIVHYFVPRAIAEIALAAAAARGQSGPRPVRERIIELRDLLKFEFYFPESELFADEVCADIARDVPDWEQLISTEGAGAVAAGLGAQVAFWALLPILDAYQIVGDELESLDRPFEEKTFLKACLARARMYRIEDRSVTGESASQVLFRSALGLAANRGLLGDAPGVKALRTSFATELREVRRLAAGDA